MHSAILDAGSSAAHLEMVALAAGEPPRATTSAKFPAPVAESSCKELLTDAVLKDEILAPAGAGAP